MAARLFLTGQYLRSLEITQCVRQLHRLVPLCKSRVCLCFRDLRLKDLHFLRGQALLEDLVCRPESNSDTCGQAPMASVVVSVMHM